MTVDMNRLPGERGADSYSTNVNEVLAPELSRHGTALDQVAAGITAMIALERHRKAKSKLGANAYLGVSLAVLKRPSQFTGLTLYRYARRPSGSTAAGA